MICGGNRLGLGLRRRLRGRCRENGEMISGAYTTIVGQEFKKNGFANLFQFLSCQGRLYAQGDFHSTHCQSVEYRVYRLVFRGFESEGLLLMTGRNLLRRRLLQHCLLIIGSVWLSAQLMTLPPLHWLIFVCWLPPHDLPLCAGRRSCNQCRTRAFVRITKLIKILSPTFLYLTFA